MPASLKHKSVAYTSTNQTYLLRKLEYYSVQYQRFYLCVTNPYSLRLPDTRFLSHEKGQISVVFVRVAYSLNSIFPQVSVCIEYPSSLGLSTLFFRVVQIYLSFGSEKRYKRSKSPDFKVSGELGSPSTRVSYTVMGLRSTPMTDNFICMSSRPVKDSGPRCAIIIMYKSESLYRWCTLRGLGFPCETQLLLSLST